MTINEPKQPRCTRFFSLEPCGIGTNLQEALPSYVERLAHSHAVPIRVFLRRELFQRRDWRRFHVQHHWTDLLLGSPEVWHAARHLATETGVSEVQKLVELPLFKYLPRERVLRKKAGWCPRCLGDWEKRGMTVYRPFLWSLKWMKSCPSHGTALHDRCAGCGLQFDLMGHSLWTANCPRCDRSLAEPARGRDDQPMTALDKICSLRMAEFFADNLTYSGKQLQRDDFADNVDTAVAAVGWKRFIQIVGCNPGTLKQWRKVGSRPQLASLLRVSCCFGLPIRDLLTNRLGSDQFLRHSSFEGARATFDLRRTKLSHQQIRQGLCDFLKAPIDKAPSVLQAARIIGVSMCLIAKHFPELASRLAKRHRQAVVRRKQQSQQERIRIVRATIQKMELEGAQVGVKSVLSRLRQDGVKGEWACYFIVARELGLRS